MQRSSIELKNFRGMEGTCLPLAEGQVTLIAGVNDAGKSTLMDAIALMLSWPVARIRYAGTSGRAKETKRSASTLLTLYSLFKKKSAI